MKTIDRTHWDRKDHFDYFRQMDYPHFDVCAPVDISKFLQFTKDNHLPFYHATVFAVTAAANRVQNLRYRIRKDTVVELDRMHPSFTSMDQNTKLFKYVTADMDDDIVVFIKSAQAKEKAQKGLFGDGVDEARDDLVYLSCLPWVSFTQVSHTIKLDKDDSIPRLTWGKYYADGNRTHMPLSLQVHHALADGYHVGQYFEALASLMASL